MPKEIALFQPDLMLLFTQQESKPLAENSTGEFFLSCPFFRIKLIIGAFLFMHPIIESVHFLLKVHE